MQRGSTDGHPTYGDGLHEGQRGEGAGTADVHFDFQNLCHCLHRLEFESHSPAGGTGLQTQSYLVGQGVNFDYSPVDFIRQMFPDFLEFPIMLQNFFNVPAQAGYSQGLRGARALPGPRAIPSACRVSRVQPGQRRVPRNFNGLFAVTRGSNWRREPADALRGLAKDGKPASSRAQIKLIEIGPVHERFHHARPEE